MWSIVESITGILVCQQAHFWSIVHAQKHMCEYSGIVGRGWIDQDKDKGVPPKPKKCRKLNTKECVVEVIGTTAKEGWTIRQRS